MVPAGEFPKNRNLQGVKEVFFFPLKNKHALSVFGPTNKLARDSEINPKNGAAASSTQLNPGPGGDLWK